MVKRNRRLLRGTAVLCVLALGAAACGSADDEQASEGSPADVEAALKKGGQLTVWAWEPTLKQVVADFEKKYPKVDVELVNAGTADDQYTALQNAVSAGDGVPDVAQIEYYALGQFAMSKSVADLAPYGADKLEDAYSPGPWSAVTANGGVHGLPMDSGPMALFYNKKVFDKHGIEVPETWDAYVDAARELKKADPNVRITADTGEAGFLTSLVWQAGGRPYTVDGTDVRIDFSDEGSKAVTATWQKLLDEDLLAPVKGWTDEWYKGLADGSIATLAAGAWMPANFESGVKGAAGDWRAAPLPQWEKGNTASAENGGSSLTVPAASGNKALAYAFTEYANAGDGVRARLAEGAFPATTEDLTSKEFLATEFDYFGGQKANEVFAESARNVADDWSYLPYQVYANSVFNDTVGKSYVSRQRLATGLEAWQRKSAEYGNDQGFSVNK
ncbi:MULTISPECIES: ABC transporter substrate-binding protein [unclassified Streptomyces]|uniref:ABC transporter substrate-binding protein n=1 Tax=unclassified Streptomyces TaxID=2593676 RepID=UPI000BF42BFD|nr:sugar ABC transporter substrate-binding protein [Streptomyces sp. Ru87]PGH51960.1 sugar ABC transporter substrate-binding protein [Streptomyces sp. Ru87]